MTALSNKKILINTIIYFNIGRSTYMKWSSFDAVHFEWIKIKDVYKFTCQINHAIYVKKICKHSQHDHLKKHLSTVATVTGRQWPMDTMSEYVVIT